MKLVLITASQTALNARVPFLTSEKQDPFDVMTDEDGVALLVETTRWTVSRGETDHHAAGNIRSGTERARERERVRAGPTCLRFMLPSYPY